MKHPIIINRFNFHNFSENICLILILLILILIITAYIAVNYYLPSNIHVYYIVSNSPDSNVSN
ncbi:hypothetical protein BD408DRAFT_424010 [Parasitella parasitica]|nr:hypothetical protein BD408DRAFT_424010 [Parasitella parasitica]